jgi:hypothetical protein
VTRQKCTTAGGIACCRNVVVVVSPDMRCVVAALNVSLVESSTSKVAAFSDADHVSIGVDCSSGLLRGMSA